MLLKYLAQKLLRHKNLLSFHNELKKNLSVHSNTQKEGRESSSNANIWKNEKSEKNHYAITSVITDSGKAWMNAKTTGWEPDGQWDILTIISPHKLPIPKRQTQPLQSDQTYCQ